MLNFVLLFVCALSGACSAASAFEDTLHVDQLSRQPAVEETAASAFEDTLHVDQLSRQPAVEETAASTFEDTLHVDQLSPQPAVEETVASTFGDTLHVDQLNRQLPERYIQLLKETVGTRIFLGINPVTSEDKHLTITMQDLQEQSPCEIALYRNYSPTPVAQATITRTEILGEHEKLQVSVHSFSQGQWQEYAFWEIFKNNTKTHPPKPKAKIIDDRMLEVSYKIHTDARKKQYFLMLLVDLGDPSHFNFSCATDQSEILFNLEYASSSTTPSVRA